MFARLLLLALLGFGLSPLQAMWFFHQATSENILNHITSLPRHLTNDPDLRLFIQPLVVGGAPDHRNRNLGVYDAFDRWSIYYERRSPSFLLGNQFSIYVPAPDDVVFVHQHISAEQDTFKRSYIDHLSLNGNSDALVFLTHNWTAGGNTYNDQFSLIGYDTSRGRWYIQAYIPSDEFTDVPEGAAWNILVKKSSDANAFEFIAEPSTLVSGGAELDHPALNNNPNAHLLITHVSGPLSVVEEFDRTQARYVAGTGRWIIEEPRLGVVATDAVFHVFVGEQSNPPEPVLEISLTPPQAFLVFDADRDFEYQLQVTLGDFVSWYNEGLPWMSEGKLVVYPTTVLLDRTFYRVQRTLKSRL